MNKLALFLFIIFLGLLAGYPGGSFFVFAASNTSGYAWSNNIGWINFGCDNCNVTVSDSAITGYAWSENYGWINLSPDYSGVANTTSGALSGYAWGEGAGWIHFDDAEINSSGQFTGTASGDVVGTINFSCASTGCPVTTTWQPSGGGSGGTGTTGGSITCSSNSQCGTNAYTGDAFCQDGNVFQNYITYTCSNPGTTSSSCSNQTQAQLVTACSQNQVCSQGVCQALTCSQNYDCGADDYVASAFCQDGNVYQNYTAYTCSNPGTASSSCSSQTQAQLKTTCSSQQVCNNGECQTAAIACSKNSDCGNNGYVGLASCQNNKVYQDYVTYTCSNPGTLSSSCSSQTQNQLKLTCALQQVCEDGQCLSSSCSEDSDCGNNGYVDSPLCQDGNVFQNYTSFICYNAGEFNSYCGSQTQAQLKATCTSQQVCQGGLCMASSCSEDSDCGVNGYVDEPFCQSNNVFQNYVIFSCANPGKSNSNCSSDTVARQKTICNSNQACSRGECLDQKHNECNEYQQCAEVLGVGSDQCAKNADCVKTYSICQGRICVQFNGLGINQCSQNSDCYTPKHNECSSQQCILVEGEGSDQCLLNTDCALTHLECRNSQCAQVAGVGINQCLQNQDCAEAKHNQCDGGQCIVVSGSGSEQCLTNMDCQNPGMGLAGQNNSHNICQNDRCVTVNGYAQDQCSKDSDCTNPVSKTIINVAQGMDIVAKQVIQQLPGPIQSAAKQARKTLQSEQGSAVVKTVTTAGVTITAVAATAATAGSAFTIPFFELFLIPIKLFGLLMSALGIRKKARPWGVVYDSVTKRPLDPAYVILKDQEGNVISTAITDIDGRYGFLVGAGAYKIEAKKTNYSFPSVKLQGKSGDELYDNLYFGDVITIAKPDEVLIKNIALDPVKFDWNEFAKKDKSLMRFYSKWDVLLRRAYSISFFAGFLVAIIAFFFAPYPYNTIIIGMYFLLLLFRIFGIKPKTYGYIQDKNTGVPLSFSIIRVCLVGLDGLPGKEIASKPTDKYGKYYCLVPPGKYYVKIEKKNDDGSYSLAYTSGIVDALRKGIIKENFKL